jgi:transcriptional regulator with XRE-family HTH domain
MDIRRKLGQRVRKYREQKGWSQEDMAEYSGLHRTYISGIERGTRNPTITIVAQLANALNVTLGNLLDGDNE